MIDRLIDGPRAPRNEGQDHVCMGEEGAATIEKRRADTGRRPRREQRGEEEGREKRPNVIAATVSCRNCVYRPICMCVSLASIISHHRCRPNSWYSAYVRTPCTVYRWWSIGQRFENCVQLDMVLDRAIESSFGFALRCCR